ncbi:MAG: hypothetical protein Q7S48_03440 [bacterium]|nr:hypothetical protein [bacterium]
MKNRGETGHEGIFEDKKQQYFTRFALRMRESLTMHKVERLWEKNTEGEKNWRNVSEHCLVEAARVDVLAELLKLSEDLKNDLIMAAALHDFDKRKEIEAVQLAEKMEASPYRASLSADAEGDRLLASTGFSSRVIRFTKGTGGHPEQLRDAKRILDQRQLSEDDIAHLIIQYVDNYTQGSAWTETVSRDSSGQRINDIDRRIAKIGEKSIYSNIIREQSAELTKDSVVQGKTVLDVMSDVGHLIEERLTAIIRERTGESVESIRLPEYIDTLIRKKIEAL